jgi:glycosyltransferase involved in cell wall biosynthesis
VKIVAILPVRNEDWVLGLSARALLQWADELVILDHCSTDGTFDIEEQLDSDRVHFIYDGNPVWREMAHRQKLLECARLRGATHIVTIDADEVVSSNLVPHMRAIVEDMPPGMVLQLPWITCRDSIHQQHASGLWAEQHASAAFVDSPELGWQAREGYDFHHRHPMGRPCVPFKPFPHAGGGILHLQYSSRRRLLWKQYLYELTEKLRWPGREPISEINKRYAYSVYGQATPPPNGVTSFDLTPVPAEWWSGYADLMQYLHVDAEPWQRAECLKILRDNPGIGEGLDDFGLLESENRLK